MKKVIRKEPRKSERSSTPMVKKRSRCAENIRRTKIVLKQTDRGVSSARKPRLNSKLRLHRAQGGYSQLIHNLSTACPPGYPAAIHRSNELGTGCAAPSP